MRHVSFKDLRLPLKAPFKISRGVKSHAHVVRVEITEGGLSGYGECCPYPHYGESVEGVLEVLEAKKGALEAGLSSESLQTLLPPGAARNALDCALLDLEAKQVGVPVSERFDVPVVKTYTTMRTISLDTPEKMANEAASYPKGAPLKVKLDMTDVVTRLQAIKAAAPTSTIMIDANEAWTGGFLTEVLPELKALGVVLIEQPLPAGADEELRAIDRIVPVLADEACHSRAELGALKGKYDAINIKLDKTGGLTEAVTMLKAAKEQGFLVMLGCMVSSSLSIAPIAHLCSHADFIDLDAPLFLKQDPDEGVIEVEGTAELKITHPWGKG